MGIFEILNEVEVNAPQDNNTEPDRNLIKSFNTGLAKAFGIPGAVADFFAAKSPPEFLSQLIQPGADRVLEIPKGEDLQRLGSEAGLTFEAGQEPNDLVSRIVENAGTAVPFAPLIPLTAAGIITEIFAIGGGAALGNLLEKDTEFGQKHPEMARATGEVIGGFGSPVSFRAALALGKFAAKGGVYRKVIDAIPFIKKIIPSASKRSAANIAKNEFEIERSLKNLSKSADDPNLKLLTPAAQENTLGAARLERTVAAENPKAERIIAKQNEIATRKLKERFIKDGNINDARELIERNVEEAINETSIAFNKLGSGSSPSKQAQVFKEKMTTAFTKSDDNLGVVWSKLSKDIIVDESDSAIISFYDDLLSKTTSGSDLNEIDPFIKLKLGKISRDKTTRTFKRGKGNLFEADVDADGFAINIDDAGNPIRDVTVESLHRFYSRLGRKVSELSQQRGQGNKIRILNDARKAILEDLDNAAVLPEYREAFDLTIQHHNKFTKGAVGDILGFGRGDTPLEGKSLNLLLGGGGEEALANIKQALSANPETKQTISDFLTSQFVLFSKNDVNNKINVDKGRQFIKKYEDIFDGIFPSVKKNLNDVIDNQKNVDFLSGASEVIDASPKVRETSAAAFLLGSDPGEEIGRLISTRSINRTDFAKSLIADASKDKTGKALRGIQSSFAENLFRSASHDGVVNGKQLRASLSELKQMSISSKMFTPEEFKNLDDIAKAFERLQFVRGAKPFKEGIINDLASKLISIPAGGVGAVVGAKLASAGGIGGSLRGAGIGAGEVAQFLKKITNNDARTLLIRSVFDKNLKIELLKNAKKLKAEQQMKIVDKLKAALGRGADATIKKVKETANVNTPRAGVSPALSSAVNSNGNNVNTETENDLVDFLKGL